MAGGASSTSDVVQTAAQVVSNREPTSASFQAASFQAASFQAASFQAVWEVDAIAWPAVTNLLCSGGQSILSELGAHLVQANATGLKTMVVTSLISGAGRSTVAMCLARCAAQAGLKVALVDGDLPSPKLAEQLNIEAAHGWNEYVAGRIPLAEAAIYSIDDKITVFPFVWQADQTGPKAIQPDHPAVHDMIGRLAAVFDLVILDAQALSHPSGKVVGCFSEGLLNAAVIVTDVDLTDRPELTAAIARLERMGVQSTGIVENFQVHLV
jgi:Mrp family chromosome partitioning ATPase